MDALGDDEGAFTDAQKALLGGGAAWPYDTAGGPQLPWLGPVASADGSVGVRAALGDPPRGVLGSPWPGAGAYERASRDDLMAALRGYLGETAQPAPKPADPSAWDVAADIAQSAATGMERTGVALAALPNTLANLARENLFWAWPDTIERHTYGESELNKLITDFAGPYYQPQTTAGRYAETMGGFALPAGLFGRAGSRAPDVLKYGLVPGAASEAAGQATEGTELEPWARIAGGAFGMLPGLASDAVAMRRLVPPASSARPTELPVLAQPAAAPELEELERLFREGGKSPSNLKPRAGETGVSFRDSLSNPIPMPKGARPVFRPGEDYIEVDPSKLPREAINRDNIPPGHVTVEGLTPEDILKAILEKRRLPK